MKRGNIIVIALSLVLLMAGGLVYKIHLVNQEAALIAKKKFAAEKAAKKAAQEKYDNALSELSDKISAAKLKTEKDFTSLLKEVDAFKKKYKEKILSYTIKNFKHNIAKKKTLRISNIMKELSQQAAPLLSQKNYTEAAKLYSNYKSDFHKRTRSERTKIHDSLIAKANTLSQQAEKLALAETNKKEKETKALCQQVVTAVFEQSPKIAYNILKDSPYTEDLKTEAEILKNLVNVDRVVLKSFASDIGKTLNVRLKKGGIKKLKIIGIKKNKIIAEAGSGKIKMQKKISLAMLSIKEKIKRLSKMDEVAGAIFYGLYLVKKKQYKTAEASFNKTGSFADILSEKAAKLAEALKKEQAGKVAEKLAKKLAEEEKKRKKKSRPRGKNPDMWSALVPKRKREFYISPTGKASGRGTKKSPWDFQSVVAGQQRVPPGSIVWVRGGDYIFPPKDTQRSPIRLSGEEGKPIHLRAYPGERARLDYGPYVTANYLWIWDLEISSTKKNWRPPGAVENWQNAFPEICGAINYLYGKGSKFINLVVHNTAGTGVSVWKNSSNMEVHGCIIYDNGVIGTDRPHGPGFYFQNNTGTVRTITDNILANNYSTGMQIRASNQKDWCNDFLIEGNVWCAPGTGAGRRNYLMTASGVNSNIIMKDNVIYGYQLRTHNGPGSEFKDNMIFRGRVDGPGAGGNLLEENPKKTRIIIRPNKYDPRRANLIVVNSKNKTLVSVDLGGFLQKGEPFLILSAFDFFGDPVAEGTYNGSKIKIRMPEIPWELDFHYSAPGSAKEFAVFIIMKQ